MAYKYNVSIAGTITTRDEYEALAAKLKSAILGIGTATLVTNMNINQWINTETMQPQEFNDDGTPYVPAEELPDEN